MFWMYSGHRVPQKEPVVCPLQWEKTIIITRSLTPLQPSEIQCLHFTTCSFACILFHSCSYIFFCPGLLFFVPPFCPFTSCSSLTASCLFSQQLKWHCEQSLLTLAERLHHTKHLKSLNWSAYTKSRMQLPNKSSINRNAEAVKTSNLAFLFNWH